MAELELVEEVVPRWLGNEKRERPLKVRVRYLRGREVLAFRRRARAYLQAQTDIPTLPEETTDEQLEQALIAFEDRCLETGTRIFDGVVTGPVEAVTVGGVEIAPGDLAGLIRAGGWMPNPEHRLLDELLDCVDRVNKLTRRLTPEQQEAVAAELEAVGRKAAELAEGNCEGRPGGASGTGTAPSIPPSAVPTAAASSTPELTSSARP